MIATLATNKNSLKKKLELPILVLLLLTGLIPKADYTNTYWFGSKPHEAEPQV